MSRILFFFSLLLFFFVGVSMPLHARAEEYIQAFDVQATLDKTRRLEIRERIDYDFGQTPRHGIYRRIPISYVRGQGLYRLPIEVLEVRQNGTPVDYTTSREDGDLSVKIGDPDKTIIGRHVYEIRYATDRAITDWSDHQELYWNVNGNGWAVLTKAVSFTLKGPASVQGAVCYTGPEGSTEHACTSTIAGDTATLVTTRALRSAEGLTIAISFPVGTMQPLPIWRTLWYWLWEHPFIVIPFLTFVFMFLIWWIHGRDPIGRGTVVAQYEEPRGLPPALLSTLAHQNASAREVTATILDLARKGYFVLKADGAVEEGKGKWQLMRTKKEATGLMSFEELILRGFASPGETVSLSAQPGTYSTVLYNVSRSLTQELVDRAWLIGDPGQARGFWFIIAFLIVLGCFIFSAQLGPTSFFAGLLSAVIVGVFGWFMPKTTKEGAILTEEIEGLKHFLSVTEKERLAFHDAPEKRPEQFSRLLAVAVALGVEKKWAEQFADTFLPAPDYVQTSASTWSALTFVHGIDHLNRNLTHGMSSPSSKGSSGFSSGGSSGGGFGGGGGGSW